MANDARFSLSEDVCPELESFFTEAINDAKDKVMTVFGDLNDINTNQPYQIVINRTREFSNNYQNEFKSKVMSLFDSWLEDGESIHRFIYDIQAGEEQDDESVKAAELLEYAMRQSIDDAFAQEPVVFEENVRVDVGEGTAKLFEDIDQILQNFDKEMAEAIDDVQSTSDDKGEDNQIYVNICGILSSILIAYQSFFEGFKEGMSEVADLLKELGSCPFEVLDPVDFHFMLHDCKDMHFRTIVTRNG